MAPIPTTFDELGLDENLLSAIRKVGYETPSPIQAHSIPPLLRGDDLLGQAQTGTGKTAAFALPLIQRINPKLAKPQLLVLTPTRELAIQVAEAIQKYAGGLPGMRILPIYGGAAYDKQIRGLKSGVQVVVGTPGRVMDHLRKGTLKLDDLSSLVLDEADEMLRMGFIDDVEWILERAPKERQTALFSATMPKVIASVAERYLRNPTKVSIEVKTTTAETVRQRYWAVQGLHKLDALTRILELEPFSAMIIFVRTKTATAELAERLEARGHRAAALNGDISQVLRERTIDRLKDGKIDILVATDVAARGLDVERISHVLNYDIPYDTESYVHRIGRTGRAGRSGEAILFVSKREVRMLRAIEKATGQKIEPMAVPTLAEISNHRVEQFKKTIAENLLEDDLGSFREIILQFQQDQSADLLDVAASLAKIAFGDQPLKMEDEKSKVPRGQKSVGFEFDESPGQGKNKNSKRDKKSKKKNAENIPLEKYRLAVGKADGVKPGDIVGAIANEAGIDSQYIGHIKLFEDYSTVELPEGMPKDVYRQLKKAWVCQKQLNLELVTAESDSVEAHEPKRSSRSNKSEFGESESRKPAQNKRSKKPNAKSSQTKEPRQPRKRAKRD